MAHHIQLERRNEPPFKRTRVGPEHQQYPFEPDFGTSARAVNEPSQEITSGYWTELLQDLQESQNTGPSWDYSLSSNFSSNSNGYLDLENSTYGLSNGSHHEVCHHGERDDQYYPRFQNVVGYLDGNYFEKSDSNPPNPPLTQICFGMVRTLGHLAFCH
jgi:hypothetical protein